MGNVIRFPESGVTMSDLLAWFDKNSIDFDTAIVIMLNDQGETRVRSTSANSSSLIWMLEVAKMVLMGVYDGETSASDEPA